MPRNISGRTRIFLALGGLVSSFACAERVPTEPSQATRPATPAAQAGSTVSQSLSGTQNQPPVLVFRTTPRADMNTNPFPTVSGPAPLSVRFNLCRSFDPDPDDLLNWQFNFGDGQTLNEDLGGGWDFARFCRVEHTYRAGRYVATLSVTDRHLDDQGAGEVPPGAVAVMARAVQKLTIDAGGEAPPPPPAAAFKIVFATSTSHRGDLIGGLAGGDAICQARAAAVGLPGTFLAWLSTGSASPSTRFTQSALPYRLVTGTQVADNWADLTDGTLDNPINRTEGGVFTESVMSQFVWTGTKEDGTAFPSANGDRCGEWAFDDTSGVIGDSLIVDNEWTQVSTDSCDSFHRLFCFQQ